MTVAGFNEPGAGDGCRVQLLVVARSYFRINTDYY